MGSGGWYAQQASPTRQSYHALDIIIITKMRPSVFLYLISYCLGFSHPHSQFSPFSFLNNLFKTPSSWSSTRQTKQFKPPVTPAKISFRPHPTVSSSFFAIQKDRKTFVSSSPQVPRPVPVNKFSVIRTVSKHNQIPSNPTISPIYIKQYTTTTTTTTTTTKPKSTTITKSDNKVLNNPSYSKTIIVGQETDNSLSKKEKENVWIKNGDTDILSNTVIPHNSFSTSHENGVSGPNPGGFPIISLIDEPSVNYYQQVFQEPVSSSSYIIPSIFKDNYSSYKDNSNPYYAPEEFTYNQDPILIDHGETDQDDFKEITKAVYDEAESVDYDSQFSIKRDSFQESDEMKIENKIKKISTSTTERPTSTPLSPIFLEQPESNEEKENIPRNIDFHSISSHHNIIREPKEITNLVNTIEYKPKDVKYKKEKSDIGKNLNKSFGSLVNCSESREVGFCSMTSSYPKERIEALYAKCRNIFDAFKAIVPEDVDTLGDNSVSVISSEKDPARPWSWKVFAYKKKQLCSSDISFIQPSYAIDTEGNWNIIVQTHSILQRVSLDTCARPGDKCDTCGNKSTCVQRFNHQMLLSLPSSSTTTSLCPSIRAFKFPSGCVCHVETPSHS